MEDECRVETKEMTLVKLAAEVMGVSEKYAVKDLKTCTDDRKENAR